MDDVTPVAYGDAWVDAANGTVSREIFVSEDVFRLELDRIFHRLWIFLAHETEIPDAGRLRHSDHGACPG